MEIGLWGIGWLPGEMRTWFRLPFNAIEIDPPSRLRIEVFGQRFDGNG